MLKKLILSESEKKELAMYDYLEIKRGGFDIVITKSVYNDIEYEIHISNPYDATSIDKQMDKFYHKLADEIRKNKRD